MEKLVQHVERTQYADWMDDVTAMAADRTRSVFNKCRISDNGSWTNSRLNPEGKKFSISSLINIQEG